MRESERTKLEIIALVQQFFDRAERMLSPWGNWKIRGSW